MKVIALDIAIEEIDALGKELSEKVFALLEDVRLLGLTKIPPNRKKKLQGDIWEFRVSGRDGIARTLYASVEKDTLHVLVAFVKKTQETPQRYMRLANDRLSRLRKEIEQ